MLNISIAILTFALLFGDERSARSMKNHTQTGANLIAKTNPAYENISSNELQAGGHIIDFTFGIGIESPYYISILHDSETSSEQLLTNFRKLNFLDYLDVRQNSTSKPGIVRTLARAHYIDVDISVFNHKYFFAGWFFSALYSLADDITTQISPDVASVEKYLNQKTDEKVYLAGSAEAKFSSNHTQNHSIAEKITNHLRTERVITNYTMIYDLSMAQADFFKVTNARPSLRNVSSQKEKRIVMDSSSLEHYTKKHGILFLEQKKHSHTDKAYSPAIYIWPEKQKHNTIVF